MLLDTGTLIGIMIALAGSCAVMVLSIIDNGKKIKQIRVLQVRVRDLEREAKKRG